MLKLDEFEEVKQKIEKYLNEHSEDIKKQMKKCFIDCIEDITEDFKFLPEDGYIEYKGWVSKEYIFSNIMSRTIPGEYKYLVLDYIYDDRSKEFLKKNIKEVGLELTNEWIEENLYDLFEIWYDFYYNRIEEVEKEIDEEMENTDLPYKVFEDITKNWEVCDWYEKCSEMFDDNEVYALRRRGIL